MPDHTKRHNVLTFILILLAAAKIASAWHTGFRMVDFIVIAVVILIIFMRLFESCSLGQQTNSARLQPPPPAASKNSKPKNILQ